MTIHRFETLDSTNNEAGKNIYSDGDVIVADFQTHGRGQRGNVWSSESSKNLMFTIVAQIKVPIYEQFYISMLAAVAAKDALQSVGVDCMIKWSNDLYVNGKKIGGILIEHNSMGEFLTKSIIGIGINVGQTEFDPKLPNPTSCANLGVSVTPEKILDLFCDRFQTNRKKSIEVIHANFMDSLWRRQGSWTFQDLHGQFQAAISNVDMYTGELTLVDSNSIERKYWFKEVEFVL